MNNENTMNDVLLIAPASGASESVIGGADGPTAVLTTGNVGMAENMVGAVQILGQGMASIFVVLGVIAVFVAALKKLDNKKK